MLCFASNQGALKVVRPCSPADCKSRQGEIARGFTTWGQASIRSFTALALVTRQTGEHTQQFSHVMHHAFWQFLGRFQITES
eukprot:s2481_g3.t1